MLTNLRNLQETDIIMHIWLKFLVLLLMTLIVYDQNLIIRFLLNSSLILKDNLGLQILTGRMLFSVLLVRLDIIFHCLVRLIT